jgi:Domain of unknown function (DUF927)
MADETEHPGLDDNVVKLADHLKKDQGKTRKPRKPRNKREMPETDRYSQSGCEMRDESDPPGLYWIKAAGIWAMQPFTVVGLADTSETGEGHGNLIEFKNVNGRKVRLFLGRDDLFGDGKHLAKLLHKARFKFSSEDAVFRKACKYLRDFDCQDRVRVSDSTEWVERNGELVGLVFRDGIVPENAVPGSPYILDPTAIAARTSEHGELDGWRSKEGAG